MHHLVALDDKGLDASIAVVVVVVGPIGSAE